MYPLPAWRKSPAAICKSLWLLWTREGNRAAVYGCVTFGKSLNLSVPQFHHVYSEDDDNLHFRGLLLKNKEVYTQHDHGKHLYVGHFSFSEDRGSCGGGPWGGQLVLPVRRALKPNEGFSHSSVVKNMHLQCRRDEGPISRFRRSPWRRKRQPTPVFLPGKSPWIEEPGGLWSVGSQRVGHD